jgi:hypothetical protein
MHLGPIHGTDEFVTVVGSGTVVGGVISLHVPRAGAAWRDRRADAALHLSR